jgi:hypothetical protein
MGQKTAIFLVILFVIVLLIVVGFILFLQKAQHPSSTPPNALNSPVIWSEPISKGNCLFYTFPSGIFNNRVITANPTYDSNVISSLIGSTQLPICLYPDGLVAGPVSETCTSSSSTVSNPLNFCPLMAGGNATVGEVQNFYSNHFCPSISACVGQLGAISPNFWAPTFIPAFGCLAWNGTIVQSATPCNPTLSSSQFVVTRISPGQNVSSLKPGSPQTGIIAQILHRASGNYLVASNSSVVVSITLSQYTSCSGSTTNVTFGNTVTLAPSMSVPNFGYVWGMIPSMKWCPSLDNCSTGVGLLITPQQIVYLGSLDVNNSPLATSSPASISGATKIVQWLQSNNVLSMYGGNASISPNGIALVPYATNIDTCDQKGTQTQFLNYSFFNGISAQEVCTAEGTNACSYF